MTTPTISTQKIVTFLWFDTQAEAAAKFYTSVFKNSRITQTTHYSEGMHLPKGRVLTVAFELEGQKFIALNGGPGVAFNDSVSLMINCDTQQEIDELWAKLIAGGGKPVQCGWLQDRYGLRWQVAPSMIWEVFNDPAKTQRMMQAMMPMVKLDLAALKKAAEGK